MPFNLKHIINHVQLSGQSILSELASDLSLLIDTTQLNRRTRLAWQQGRTTRACYLMVDHQRRRITRRREIRRLVEG